MIHALFVIDLLVAMTVLATLALQALMTDRRPMGLSRDDREAIYCALDRMVDDLECDIKMTAKEDWGITGDNARQEEISALTKLRTRTLALMENSDFWEDMK